MGINKYKHSCRGQIPRTVIAGSYRSYMFSFLRNCPTFRLAVQFYAPTNNV